MKITIRAASHSDWPAIWKIFRDVVRAGDSFSYTPDTDEETAKALWVLPPSMAFVAEVDGMVAGTFYVKPNQPGLGSHVANAGFMVAKAYSGKGIGRAMGETAIAEAKTAGFLAMQFNYVVSTNTRAVELWKSLGFTIIGTIPRGFKHITEGFVDVYIMHRAL